MQNIRVIPFSMDTHKALSALGFEEKLYLDCKIHTSPCLLRLLSFDGIWKLPEPLYGEQLHRADVLLTHHYMQYNFCLAS